MIITDTSNEPKLIIPIIAIDGPSASGKGTIARRLAEHLNFAHLDTGLLYRAVALSVLTGGKDASDPIAALNAAQHLNLSSLQSVAADPELREEKTSKAASKVAAMPEIRASLLKFQQDFCRSPPNNKAGSVLDGRDIGTIIAPQASVKLYITASPEARAERRFKELRERGESVSHAAVLADMLERDARDASRSVAPAKPALDALIIDTTSLTADEALKQAVLVTEARLQKFYARKD